MISKMQCGNSLLRSGCWGVKWSIRRRGKIVAGPGRDMGREGVSAALCVPGACGHWEVRGYVWGTVNHW